MRNYVDAMLNDARFVFNTSYMYLYIYMEWFKTLLPVLKPLIGVHYSVATGVALI